MRWNVETTSVVHRNLANISSWTCLTVFSLLHTPINKCILIDNRIEQKLLNSWGNY